MLTDLSFHSLTLEFTYPITQSLTGTHNNYQMRNIFMNESTQFQIEYPTVKY